MLVRPGERFVTFFIVKSKAVFIFLVACLNDDGEPGGLLPPLAPPRSGVEHVLIMMRPNYGMEESKNRIVK